MGLLGAPLGTLWALLGTLWGPTWNPMGLLGNLEPSCGRLGPSWSRLVAYGVSSGHLESPWTPSDRRHWALGVFPYHTAMAILAFSIQRS
eukprot:9493606-Pyramimonas_sp.AAC.2